MPGKSKMTLDKLAMLTQRGFSELEGKLRNELKQEINGLKGDLRNELKQEIDGLRNEMNNRFNEVDGNFDAVFKDLEEIKTDNSARFLQYKRHENSITNHEKRIEKLETAKV